MRQLHEVLWYLAEALALAAAAPLHDDVRAARSRVDALTAGTAQELAAVDVGVLRQQVGDLLGRVSELARGPGKPDRRGADLMGRDLRRERLADATLRGAYLIGADLRAVDLDCADLLGADLRGADVRGTDLSRCLFLTRPQVTAARADTSTRLPVAVATPARRG